MNEGKSRWFVVVSALTPIVAGSLYLGKRLPFGRSDMLETACWWFLYPSLFALVLYLAVFSVGKGAKASRFGLEFAAARGRFNRLRLLVYLLAGALLCSWVFVTFLQSALAYTAIALPSEPWSHKYRVLERSEPRSRGARLYYELQFADEKGRRKMWASVPREVFNSAQLYPHMQVCLQGRSTVLGPVIEGVSIVESLTESCETGR